VQAGFCPVFGLKEPIWRQVPFPQELSRRRLHARNTADWHKLQSGGSENEAFFNRISPLPVFLFRNLFLLIV
jgi:uncharacterized FlgJ-related protein